MSASDSESNAETDFVDDADDFVDDELEQVDEETEGDDDEAKKDKGEEGEEGDVEELVSAADDDEFSESTLYTSDVKDYRDMYVEMAQQEKKSTPFMTKYERARVIGYRLLQLDRGALPIIDTQGMKSNREIAYKELETRKMPVIISRTMPAGGATEYWRLEEFIDILH